MNIIELAERAVLPDILIRFGIRRLLKQRLRDEYQCHSIESQQEQFSTFLTELRDSPIAIATDSANEQHYEVPSEFYLHALGLHLKYSSCYWPEQVTSLNEAEEAMLALTCERANIIDGQQILELGCGWGSLSLWMAKQYPNSNIVAVSNSSSQKDYILKQAEQEGYKNLKVITCDMNDFDIDSHFDRVISIEMFEHMRNYETLMTRISGWLNDTGKLFVHIFCHRFLMYPFETEGDDNWMGQYFFTGGTMPAADTLLHFQNHLQLEQRWLVDGTHYQKTLEAWLQKTDANKEEIMKTLEEAYGPEQASIWLQRWRMFFMACAELFGYRQGKEWLVAHYLFSK